MQPSRVVSRPDLVVVRDSNSGPVPPLAVRFDTLVSQGLRGLARRFFRYRDVTLVTYRLETVRRPLLTATIVRLLARRRARVEDRRGRSEAVTVGHLGGKVVAFAADAIRSPVLLASVARAVDQLDAQDWDRKLDQRGAPVYLRTDLWFGLRSGGSVAHIAGVVNCLEDAFGSKPPVVVTTDALPLIHPHIELHEVRAGSRYRDFPELSEFAATAEIERAAMSIFARRRVSFLFQRYSLNNFAGVALSKALRVPLVLEYNGSEVWMRRHWQRPLRHERLSLRVEDLSLKKADLVVVVSAAMRAEVVARGVNPGSVLVNPNGVDTDSYSPDVDGSAVRGHYGLSGRIVIGFIGTFGPWHGAEVLATAYARLLETRPDLRDALRLLLIGDGIKLAETKRRLEDAGVLGSVAFAGRTNQVDGPKHLAACDVLVSPHVPNPDGTPFFGSPTKLFEYMAMGKAIVASDLDQIGDVIVHDETGWLVAPGDASALAAGLATVVDDAVLRARLGRAARERAVVAHTWRAHTERIAAALKARYA